MSGETLEDESRGKQEKKAKKRMEGYCDNKRERTFYSGQSKSVSHSLYCMLEKLCICMLIIK
jgi:hypothetical protein